jgi:pimeloyl-ACP methyl ester carboxylesterase
VFAHGAAFDEAGWAPLASWLACRGHQVLASDFRGYGRSTAGADSHALFEDVLAAVGRTTSGNWLTPERRAATSTSSLLRV